MPGALLRFADNEAGVDRVAELAKLAKQNQPELYMSSVNWGEVVYALLRAQGTQDDADLIKGVLPLNFVHADDSQSERAAQMRHRYRIQYADAFAAALTQDLSATLVTADYDFEKLRHHLTIELLPAKP
jgi:predicted nucleic acid-binding protein